MSFFRPCLFHFPTPLPKIYSGRQSRSLVARVLASVSDLTDEVGSFPRSSEELFLLVRELAMGHEAVRRHLLGSEMAARLAIFVMRDHSLHEVTVAQEL